MTGLQTIALILGLYVTFEVIAIPFGHMIGKRASAARLTLLVIVCVSLLATSVMLLAGSR